MLKDWYEITRADIKDASGVPGVLGRLNVSLSFMFRHAMFIHLFIPSDLIIFFYLPPRAAEEHGSWCFCACKDIQLSLKVETECNDYCYLEKTDAGSYLAKKHFVFESLG